MAENERDTPNRMTSDGSKLGEAIKSNAKSSDAAPGGGPCCGLFGRRKAAPPPFDQVLVVLRHSERLDHMDPDGYKSSEEGKQFPHDTPLTEAGVALAQKVAAELEEVHKTRPFAAIASSPYRRCLQTAAEVAHRLNVPVFIDQEIGEVWDENMPKEHTPYRSPLGVREIVDSLRIRVLNPKTEDGGVKFFGKPPLKWPETIEDAHKRYLTRMSYYIEKSGSTRQNFVLVSHCPSIVAALDIFARGNVDIKSVAYCGRVIVSRKASAKTLQDEDFGDSSVFAAKWDMECKDAKYELCDVGNMAKYYEGMHLENCEEQQKKVVKRRESRTQTDAVFDESLQDLIKQVSAECVDG